MFYCEKCADKNEWPYEFYMPISVGPCECCGKTRACTDVPSGSLPEPKKERRSR